MISKVYTDSSELIAAPVSTGGIRLSIAPSLRNSLQQPGPKGDKGDKGDKGSTGAGTSGGQVLIYTTDPTTDGLFPTNQNSPAIAYQKDGLGPTITWNTDTHTWNP